MNKGTTGHPKQCVLGGGGRGGEGGRGRGGERGGGGRGKGKGRAGVRTYPRHGGWLWSTAPGTYAGHFRVVQVLGFRVLGLGIGVWGFLFLKTKVKAFVLGSKRF